MINCYKNLASFLFIFLFGISFSFSQVVINEYSCSNISGPTDAFGDNEDWIELFNTTGSAIDLTGYYLSDKASNLEKWTVPSGSIPANGYKMVYCSGRNTVSGTQYHPNFRLTQTKNEWIILTLPNGNVMDSIKIVHLTKENNSVGRQTNGAATWKLFITPTPNAANTGAVNFYTANPVMSINGGFYTGTQSVSMSCPEAGTTIRYTTNGSDPTATSTLYTAPISVSTTTVIRAKAFGTNLPSFTNTNTFFINVDHTIPVISVGSAQVYDLIANGNGWTTNYKGFFEYYNSDNSFVDEGDGDYNKHGNDSWAYDQRGFDFIMRDQFGINDAVDHQIFPEEDRTSFQRLILKPAANDNVSFEDGAHIRDAFVHTLSQKANLKMDERTWKPCVLYINGQYWGVYEIREKADDGDYTEHYFNQDKFNIQYLKTWGGTWEDYGAPNALNNWNTFKNFVASNNMGTPANFAHVDTTLNWQSLVDYFVLNSYVVSQDWLNWNTSWWRGLQETGEAERWRYSLWDMDATFGHYINYTGIPDASANADPCNVENLPDPGGQGHTDILQKLIDENPIVSQYYITRYADLINTYFSCNYMNFLLDSMIQQIEPEMAGQCAKWGGTYAGWQANVQELKNFIDARCVALEQGLIDCYDLTGPFALVVNVTPPGAGEVKVNSIWAPTYPWTTEYFGGINTNFIARENPGYIFSHWTFTTGPMINGISQDTNAMVINSPENVTAVFIVDNPDFDGDGILNTDEVTLGTDPNNPDTDGDGVPDGTEVTNGSDPLDPCDPSIFNVICDADGDGLPNDNEPLVGTDPNNPDTDGDGVNDGNEINGASDPLNPCSPNPNNDLCDEDGDGISNPDEAVIGTNPTNPDTDGDGFEDGFEVSNGTDPLNPCDPDGSPIECNTDTDGDGLVDYHELSLGTDPNNPDTDDDGINDGVEIGNGTDPLDHCDPNPVGDDCFNGFFLPNAFTPNGDGLNDVFKPRIGRDVVSFTWSIYDRWGNKMVQTSDAEFTWDGVFNGVKVNTGVYAFIAEYVLIDGTTTSFSGNITLTR